jgi:hypothetical protein
MNSPQILGDALSQSFGPLPARVLGSYAPSGNGREPLNDNAVFVEARGLRVSCWRNGWLQFRSSSLSHATALAEIVLPTGMAGMLCLSGSTLAVMTMEVHDRRTVDVISGLPSPVFRCVHVPESYWMVAESSATVSASATHTSRLFAARLTDTASCSMCQELVTVNECLSSEDTIRNVRVLAPGHFLPEEDAPFGILIVTTERPAASHESAGSIRGMCIIAALQVTRDEEDARERLCARIVHVVQRRYPLHDANAFDARRLLLVVDTCIEVLEVQMGGKWPVTFNTVVTTVRSSQVLACSGREPGATAIVVGNLLAGVHAFLVRPHVIAPTMEVTARAGSPEPMTVIHLQACGSGRVLVAAAGGQAVWLDVTHVQRPPVSFLSDSVERQSEPIAAPLPTIAYGAALATGCASACTHGDDQMLMLSATVRFAHAWLYLITRTLYPSLCV